MLPIRPRNKLTLRRCLCALRGHGNQAKHTLNKTDYYYICGRCGVQLSGVITGPGAAFSAGRQLGATFIKAESGTLLAAVHVDGDFMHVTSIEEPTSIIWVREDLPIGTLVVVHDAEGNSCNGLVVHRRLGRGDHKMHSIVLLYLDTWKDGDYV